MNSCLFAGMRGLVVVRNLFNDYRQDIFTYIFKCETYSVVLNLRLSLSLNYSTCLEIRQNGFLNKLILHFQSKLFAAQRLRMFNQSKVISNDYMYYVNQILTESVVSPLEHLNLLTSLVLTRFWLHFVPRIENFYDCKQFREFLVLFKLH